VTEGIWGFKPKCSAEDAFPAGAAVVYTPPKCEAGQTEGSGGRGAGGGRLVKSPPPAAVFFPRFLLGIQKKSGRRRQGKLRSATHCQNPPVILQSKMPAPFPRGPYANCTALLPPSLREVAFAKRKTEGVSLLTIATPPVTAYAATAPSARGPWVHAFRIALPIPSGSP